MAKPKSLPRACPVLGASLRGSHGLAANLDARCMYGVQVSLKKKANHAAVDALVRHLPALQWSQDAASHYAEIRAELKKKGSMIGANDLMIAAHARSLSAIVVTNNAQAFARVKGLEVENWLV